jgi:hypothetical protein
MAELVQILPMDKSSVSGLVDQLDSPDRAQLGELLGHILRIESVPAVFGEVAS